LNLDLTDSRKIAKLNLNRQLTTRTNILKALHHMNMRGGSTRAAIVFDRKQVGVPFQRMTHCRHQIHAGSEVDRETTKYSALLRAALDWLGCAERK
jgi:hypothetical protein